MLILRLSISGLVQGVGYRDAMRREARALGVRGWVRNRRDGSVEAHLEGDDAAVRALLDWARRGPRMARVSDVRSEPAEPLQGAAPGFEVLPSA